MNAFIVMVLVPEMTGTVADQLAVPAAVPELPVELLHVTEVTSLDAVPEMARVSAEVETMVKAGVVIFRAGGLPDGGVAGAVGVAGVGGVVGVVGLEAGGAA